MSSTLLVPVQVQGLNLNGAETTRREKQRLETWENQIMFKSHDIQFSVVRNGRNSLRRSMRSLALLICALSLYLCGPKAAWPASNFCPFGTCDIATPVYVNVYWGATWDTDIAATAPDMTRARIDSLLDALVHSDYFTDLRQYGVTSSSSMPSITESGFGPPPPTIDVALNSMGLFAAFVMSRHPELNPAVTILNVFLPPQTVPTSSTADFCSRVKGEHDKYGSPVAVTVIPTSMSCNGSISGLLSTLSHEMVEAATDPDPNSPTGWKVAGGDELSDQCQSAGGLPAPFMYATVQGYWSNRLNGCSTGFSVVPPVISSGSVVGTGKLMRITLNGNFGQRPWDLPASSPATKTLYLQAAVSGSHRWSAGNIAGFPADTVGFNNISWTAGSGPGGSDTIVVSGFDSGYGSAQPLGGPARVSPGDTVTMTVWSWANGQRGTFRLTARGPAAGTLNELPAIGMSGLRALYQFAGAPGEVDGTLTDAAGGPVEGSVANIHSNDPTDSISALAAISDSSGQVRFNYTPTMYAGLKTISMTSPVSASTTISVYPVMNSLVPAVGSVAGSQPIILSGAGFDPNTTIAFNGAALPRGSVHVISPTSVRIDTPASPLGGDGSGQVEVTATVGGVTSFPLQYRYIVAGKPVIRFLSQRCSTTFGDVVAYNLDGSMRMEVINMTAPYPAFTGSMGLASAITVNTGQAFSVSGLGPITATVATNPALSASQSIPVVPQFCLPSDAGIPADFALTWPWDAGPMVPNTCRVCGDNGSEVAVWRMTKVAREGNFLMLNGAGAVADSTQWNAVSLGVAQLRALVRNNSVVFLHGAADSDQVAFVGPSMSLSLPSGGKRAGANAAVSFAAPRGQSSTFRVVQLTNTKGGAAWQDVTMLNKSAVDTQIRGSVQSSGVYALVQIQKAGGRVPSR